VNSNQANKPMLVRRYAVPIVLGALAVGILAVLIGSFVRSANASTPAAPNSAPAALQATAVPPTPTPVQVGSSASAISVGRITGNLASANQASLVFQMPGKIQAFKVKEGDKVRQGDVLASIDATAIQLQVAQAQAALTLAQARLDQTKTGGTPTDIAAARAAVAAAQANYNRVAQGPTADDIAIAKSNLDKAKAALDQAQSAYDKAGGATNPYVNLLPSTLNLQLATSNYQAAEAGYNLAKNHPTEPELAGAAVQLVQAQSVLARLTPTSDDLTIAQAQVDQAQAALDAAKQNLANANIVAPFDGTVVWIGPHVGENANAQSTAIVLADLAHMQVQANVDEITLSGLKVGQHATMSVDALGDRTLTGRVSKIGLFGTNAGGIVSVPVWIDMDPTDAPVFPGLTATVQFDTGQ
jgi:HlyD family secretion protein